MQETEDTLRKSSLAVDELLAGKLARERRNEVEGKRHDEEGRSWQSETMAIELQLKDSENSEKSLRDELTETKRSLQQKTAELVSLTNTSDTIQIVKETAEARAKSEGGRASEASY